MSEEEEEGEMFEKEDWGGSKREEVDPVRARELDIGGLMLLRARMARWNKSKEMRVTLLLGLFHLTLT